MRLRQNGVSTRVLDGETVVLDLVTSRYLFANASGTVVLRELQQKCSEEDLTRALVAEFDVDEATAREDVRSFVGSLRELGLLDHANGS